MGKIKVKGGTPNGWASLCTTCAWAHIVSGFRESELVVICTEVNPKTLLSFPSRCRSVRIISIAIVLATRQ